MSEETLMGFDRFKEILDKCKDDAYVEDIINSETQANNNWHQELNKNDEGLNHKPDTWYMEEYDDTDWRKINLPASFRGTELEPIRGSIWLRKEIGYLSIWQARRKLQEHL